MVARKQTVQELKLDIFQSDVNWMQINKLIKWYLLQIVSKLYKLIVTWFSEMRWDTSLNTLNKSF